MVKTLGKETWRSPWKLTSAKTKVHSDFFGFPDLGKIRKNQKTGSLKSWIIHVRKNLPPPPHNVQFKSLQKQITHAKFLRILFLLLRMCFFPIWTYITSCWMEWHCFYWQFLQLTKKLLFTSATKSIFPMASVPWISPWIHTPQWPPTFPQSKKQHLQVFNPKTLQKKHLNN